MPGALKSVIAISLIAHVSFWTYFAINILLAPHLRQPDGPSISWLRGCSKGSMEASKSIRDLDNHIRAFDQEFNSKNLDREFLYHTIPAAVAAQKVANPLCLLYDIPFPFNIPQGVLVRLMGSVIYGQLSWWSLVEGPEGVDLRGHLFYFSALFCFFGFVYQAIGTLRVIFAKLNARKDK